MNMNLRTLTAGPSFMWILIPVLLNLWKLKLQEFLKKKLDSQFSFFYLTFQEYMTFIEHLFEKRNSHLCPKNQIVSPWKSGRRKEKLVFHFFSNKKSSQNHVGQRACLLGSHQNSSVYSLSIFRNSNFRNWWVHIWTEERRAVLKLRQDK